MSHFLVEKLTKTVGDKTVFQDISFIQDDHLNIIINYLFDLAALCANHQELQV